MNDLIDLLIVPQERQGYFREKLKEFYGGFVSTTGEQQPPERLRRMREITNRRLLRALISDLRDMLIAEFYAIKESEGVSDADAFSPAYQISFDERITFIDYNPELEKVLRQLLTFTNEPRERAIHTVIKWIEDGQGGFAYTEANEEALQYRREREAQAVLADFTDDELREICGDTPELAEYLAQRAENGAQAAEQDKEDGGELSTTPKPANLIIRPSDNITRQIIEATQYTDETHPIIAYTSRERGNYVKITLSSDIDKMTSRPLATKEKKMLDALMSAVYNHNVNANGEFDFNKSAPVRLSELHKYITERTDGGRLTEEKAAEYMKIINRLYSVKVQIDYTQDYLPAKLKARAGIDIGIDQVPLIAVTHSFPQLTVRGKLEPVIIVSPIAVLNQSILRGEYNTTTITAHESLLKNSGGRIMINGTVRNNAIDNYLRDRIDDMKSARRRGKSYGRVILYTAIFERAFDRPQEATKDQRHDAYTTIAKLLELYKSNGFIKGYAIKKKSPRKNVLIPYSITITLPEDKEPDTPTDTDE